MRLRRGGHKNNLKEKKHFNEMFFKMSPASESEQQDARECGGLERRLAVSEIDVNWCRDKISFEAKNIISEAFKVHPLLAPLLCF